METNAERFFNSSKIQKLTEQLMDELKQAQSKVQGVRPPMSERVESYKKTLEHLNNIRGRNLFYPYLASGFGSGPYVELVDGSVKIDLINGIGINLFGHGHHELTETAIQASMRDVVIQGNLQPTQEYGEILDLLIKAAGRKSRIKKGWITTCGTIANENALKIVRQKNTPARKTVAFKDCFAGRSTLMAEITDNPEYRVGLPTYNEVVYVPFFDKKDPQSTQKSVDALKKHIADNPKNIACFVLELVQGEGGFNTAPPEFFIKLFEICREYNIAIWLDEIQTFARTGELFAFETLGLGEYADIVTLAKTAQCGAVLYTEDYNPKPGLIAGTFTSSTVSLAAGAKTLKMLLDEDEKILGPNGKIQKLHHKFLKMLQDLKEGSCREHIKEFGGIGLMVSLTPYDGTKDKVTKLLHILFNNGIIAFSCGHGPYKIRFLLPLVLEDSHISEVKECLEKSLKQGAQAP